MLETINILYLLRPRRYKMSELIDWFHRVRIRNPEEYGYRRIDLKYTPLFKLKVTLNEMIALAQPLGFLQWEHLERVCMGRIPCEIKQFYQCV